MPLPGRRRGYAVVVPIHDLIRLLDLPPGVTVRGITDAPHLDAILIAVHDPQAEPVEDGTELPRRFDAGRR